jgi:Tfp pilus assembly protein PilF
MHVALGREKEAEAAFLEAIRKDPKNLDANLEMAGISLRLRKMNQAFDFLAETKKLMSAEEENPVSLVFRYRQMLAMAYLARQEYKSAHRIFSDLIALDRDFIPAYVALAQSYLAQERIQTAEFIAKRGLDRSQKDAGLINILGIVALRKGQQLEARRFFDDAIQLQPSFAQARLNRASLAIQNGEFEAAEQDIKKALEDAPGVVDGYVTQAVLFRKTGRIQGAKEALNTALEMQPEHAVARYNLALLYAESLSDVASAKRLLSEVSAMDATPSQIKKSADLYLDMLQNSQVQHQ